MTVQFFFYSSMNQTAQKDHSCDKSSSLFEYYQSSDDQDTNLESQAGKFVPNNKRQNQDLSTSQFIFEVDTVLQENHKSRKQENILKPQILIKNTPICQEDDSLDLKQILDVIQEAINYESTKKQLNLLTGHPYIQSKRHIHNRKYCPCMQRQYKKYNIFRNRNQHLFRKQLLGQPLRQERCRYFNGKYTQRPCYQPRELYFNQRDNLRPATIKRQPYRKNWPRKDDSQFAAQDFIFRNVLISVKLCSYMNLHKNVLLVPFSNIQFSDAFPKQVLKNIKYNMKEIIHKQNSKNNKQQVQIGYVFSVKAKGLQSNYKGIYFLKSSQNKMSSLEYYDKGMLRKSIKNVFNLLDSHMQHNIVIPDVQWGCLLKTVIAQIIISQIFKQINQQFKNTRCKSLRQVNISVSNCDNFQTYVKYLRAFMIQLM